MNDSIEEKEIGAILSLKSSNLRKRNPAIESNLRIFKIDDDISEMSRIFLIKLVIHGVFDYVIT